MDPHLVITTLVDQGIIPAEQSDALLQAVLESGRAPEDFLIEEGHIDEHTFYQTIAQAIGANYIDLTCGTRVPSAWPVFIRRCRWPTWMARSTWP